MDHLEGRDGFGALTSDNPRWAGYRDPAGKAGAMRNARWLLLTAVMALAVACSGGSDEKDSGRAAEAVAAAVTTTTSTVLENPEVAYDIRLSGLLTGESEEFRKNAAELSKSMCGLLDQTAEAGTVSDEATTLAMDAASGTGLEAAVNETVLTAGAEVFCPQYTETVTAYFQSR